MTTDAAARIPFHRWTRLPDQIRRRAGRAIWEAAESGADPLAAIRSARQRADELLDRLAATAPPGEHLATCLARGEDGEPGMAADLALARRGRICLTDRAGAGAAFGALLLLGVLTGEPVGVVLRSCRDPCHTLSGHRSAVRGWLLRDGYAAPMSRGAIRTVAGGRVPHPGLPAHPEEGTLYEKAYSLYEAGEESRSGA